MATIHLSDADKAFIDEQVEAGTFRDADDVVRAGLRLLISEQGKIEELRRMIDEADQQVAEGNVIEVLEAGDHAQSIVERGRKLLGKRG
jgi:antitoxin ParD1/3/4